MEHTIDDETERAICKSLKHRNTCPDDQKLIPPCDLRFRSCDECQKWEGESVKEAGRRRSNLVNLSLLKDHEVGQVDFIRGDSRLLRRLSDLGVTLGAKLEVTRSGSARAPVEISLRGSKIALDRDIASSIFLEPALEAEMVRQPQEALSTVNKKLEERNRQNSIMSEMRALLQSCSSIQEMPPIIVVSITRLFPNADGALFLMNSSHKDLQSIARWGDFTEDVDENIFEPDDCWALRRGRIHEVEDVEIGPICPHLKHAPPAPYMCLPLIAKGDILGLLHLRIKLSTSGQDRWNSIVDLKETLVIFAEYLSLSIANIRLWERLTDQSIRDPLTGLFNRRYMEETIQREILRAAQSQSKIGIIMADIDHFKNFNDSHGHEAGDELLMKMADFFKYEIRGSDTACRYGGEEFILILPGASTEGAYKRAEHLREEVKNLKAHFRDRLLPPVTLSMGIATYPDHGTELSDLIQVADAALYRAKGQGRDRIVTG